jgi:hypothetical protein
MVIRAPAVSDQTLDPLVFWYRQKREALHFLVGELTLAGRCFDENPALSLRRLVFAQRMMSHWLPRYGLVGANAGYGFVLFIASKHH